MQRPKEIIMLITKALLTHLQEITHKAVHLIIVDRQQTTIHQRIIVLLRQVVTPIIVQRVGVQTPIAIPQHRLTMIAVNAEVLAKWHVINVKDMDVIHALIAMELGIIGNLRIVIVLHVRKKDLYNVTRATEKVQRNAYLAMEPEK